MKIWNLEISLIMRVTLRKKNIDLTPALENYIDNKIVRPVEKLVQNSAGSDLPLLEIEIGRFTDHHQKGMIYFAAANLALGAKKLYARVENEDIRAACDLLEENLKREIIKFKGKLLTLEKRRGRSGKKDLHFDPAARLYRKGRIRDEGN